jgi:hypothetical protein
MPYPYKEDKEEPINEPHSPTTLEEIRAQPNPIKKPKPDSTVSILFTVMTLITLGSIYLLATAPTGICADKINESYKYGLASAAASINDKCPDVCIDSKIFDQGYSKCIADTQNATLIYGYCSAQQEFIANGQYLMNDTVLVVPASIIKPICK